MTTPRHHILGLRASNIKSLTLVDIKPDGQIHTIAGKNGQGKTALLEAIESALTGLEPELIRHGSDAAEVVLTLTNATIRRALSADDRETLMITDASGHPIAKGKEFLKTLCAASNFRPIEWVQLGGGDSRGRTERLRKQRAQLIEAIPLTVTAEQIQQAVVDLGPEYCQVLAALGQDLAQVNLDQHALEVCRELHDLIYAARQEKNADEKRLKLLLDTTPTPTAAPPVLPVPELEARLAQARDAYYAAKAQAETHANANAARTLRAATLEHQIAQLKSPYTRDELQASLDTTLAALQTLTLEIDRLREELDRIQRLHAEAINHRAQAQTTLNDIRLCLQSLDQRDALQTELDALQADAQASTPSHSSSPSHPSYSLLETLDANLTQAKRDLDNARAQAAYDQAHATHAQAKSLSDLYTALVSLFRDTLPKTLLQAARLPIPGLEIHPDYIAINGTPLHNLSTSEQIRVGVAIAATLSPACGFVLVDGAESLDPDSRLALKQAAQELNLQLILTLVDPDATPSENTTVIQNGQALGSAGVPPA